MLCSWARRMHNNRGFTLIELLIVVAIIAILAAILIPNYLQARTQAQLTATKGNLKNVATALESYFVANAAYPQLPTDLAPKYVAAMPRDPCTGAMFGTMGGYLYFPNPLGVNPATDYWLTTSWMPGASGDQCYRVNGNHNLLYTPGGGLSTW